MISLKELIDEGESLRNYYEDLKSGNYFVEKASFFEWSTKALMYLQDMFSKHPQIEALKKYILKEDVSFEAFSHMIAILKAFDVIKHS